MVQFIGVGTQKAGTTWLWSMLKQHPQVRFSPLKEVHYFDTLYLGAARGHRLKLLERGVERQISELEEEGAPPQRIAQLRRLADRSFAFTDTWYGELFPTDSPYTGDITPNYCALPDQGIQHVKRLSPGARLISIIRDPVERGVSSLRHMVNEKRSVEDLLGSEEYLSRGDYRTNIPRWERHFPQEQFLYIPFGDIKKDPAGVLRRVEQHIGLEPHDAYNRLDVPRASTTDRGVVLPEGVEQRIARVFEGQEAFLRQRFGDDFVARIA
ncbi:MAG TPA: sulfotransferase [Devosia sp.]|jgi:hypothetical protein|nr:sulfotransferase [Devosia sp.]